MPMQKPRANRRVEDKDVLRECTTLFQRALHDTGLPTSVSL